MRRKKKPQAASGKAAKPEQVCDGIAPTGGEFTAEEIERLERWAARYLPGGATEPETMEGDAPEIHANGTSYILPKPIKEPVPKPGSWPPPGYLSSIEWLAHGDLPPVIEESLRAHYGFADWRLALLLVAMGKNGEIEHADLATWMMNAVTKFDGDELRVFAKCLDALKAGQTRHRAKALALHFATQRQLKFGRLPTKAEVRDYLIQNGVSVPEKDSSGWKNLARDLFSGAVLGRLPRAKPGPIGKPKK